MGMFLYFSCFYVFFEGGKREGGLLFALLCFVLFCFELSCFVFVWLLGVRSRNLGVGSWE